MIAVAAACQFAAEIAVGKHYGLALVFITPLALTVFGAMSLLFAVAFDQGQLAQALQAAAGDSTVHEYFHDARHMLGFPCH